MWRVLGWSVAVASQPNEKTTPDSTTVQHSPLAPPPPTHTQWAPADTRTMHGMHLRSLVCTVVVALAAASLLSLVAPTRLDEAASAPLAAAPLEDTPSVWLTAEELCWQPKAAIYSWPDGRMCWNEVEDSMGALDARYQRCLRTKEEAEEAADSQKDTCVAHFDAERSAQSVLPITTLPTLLSALPNRFVGLLTALLPFKLLLAHAADTACSNHGALVTASPLKCTCDNGWLKTDCSKSSVH